MKTMHRPPTPLPVRWSPAQRRARRAGTAALMAAGCSLFLAGTGRADDTGMVTRPALSQVAVADPSEPRGKSEAHGSAKSDTPRATAKRNDDKRSDDAVPPVVIAPVPELNSPAEKVARLRRSIEADQRRLSELQMSLQEPGGNFGRSEEEFRKLDEQLESARAEWTRLEKSPDKEALGRAESRWKEIQEAREKSKQRFEAAIAERRVTQETVQNLELKIRSDQEALDKLLGQTPVSSAADVATPPPVVVPAASPGTVVLPNAAVPVPAPPPPTTVADLLQTSTGTKLPTAAPPAASPTVVASLPPSATAAPGAPASGLPGSVLPGTVLPGSVLPGSALPGSVLPGSVLPGTPLPSNSTASAKTNNKALQEAAVAAQRTVAEADRAEQEARSVTERIELLRRNINSERRLRDSSQARADEADQAVRDTSDEMHRVLLEGRDASQVIERLQEAEERRREARREALRVATHLDELQTEFARLQSEQIEALEEAQSKRDAADEALRRVETLQNPFTPRNLLQWLVDHGPPILGVIFAIMVTLWLSRVLGRRLIGLLVGRGLRDSLEERENRAHTLAGVVHNAVNVGAVAVGIVTILDEVGVPVGPVMGGAAVLGLAVAFGAQSLIKDYFTGFMLLVEQQYLVNDVVKIGDIAGQVERISLRMTVLRDIEGQAHFIPHGQITTVSNLTHSWSRAVFDIGISYSENVDRAIDELICLARELRQDPQFGRLITEDVTMLGVDKLAESAIIIKFFLKTRPLQQWSVKRELLRRIKNRFDELGIEIPYPQRILHVRESQAPRPVTSEAA